MKKHILLILVLLTVVTGFGQTRRHQTDDLVSELRDQRELYELLYNDNPNEAQSLYSQTIAENNRLKQRSKVWTGVITVEVLLLALMTLAASKISRTSMTSRISRIYRIAKRSRTPSIQL